MRKLHIQIRPDTERQALNKIRQSQDGKQPGLWNYQSALRETDVLQDEAMMVDDFERREAQRERAAQIAQRTRNPRSRDWER